MSRGPTTSWRSTRSSEPIPGAGCPPAAPAGPGRHPRSAYPAETGGTNHQVRPAPRQQPALVDLIAYTARPYRNALASDREVMTGRLRGEPASGAAPCGEPSCARCGPVRRSAPAAGCTAATALTAPPAALRVRRAGQPDIPQRLSRISPTAAIRPRSRLQVRERDLAHSARPAGTRRRTRQVRARRRKHLPARPIRECPACRPHRAVQSSPPSAVSGTSRRYVHRPHTSR